MDTGTGSSRSPAPRQHRFWAVQDKMSSWVLVHTLLCSWAGLGTEEGRAGPQVTCLNNNILRIDCCGSPELGQDAWLLFTSHQAPGSQHRCNFQAGSCTVQLPPEEVLVTSDCFSITLHRLAAGKELVSLVDPQYLPRKHVKLDPPTNLQSNVSAGHCMLTWAVSTALEPLSMLLSYELAFKRREEAWERAKHKHHILGATWLLLEAFELDPDATYEARLRMQMAEAEDDALEEERYEGQWSEWSQPVAFPSPRKGPPHPPRGQPDSTLFTVALFLLLTSLAYILCKLSPRVKRNFHQKVPSPAAFFQPLYNVHHGNFQTWIGAHSVDPQLRGCVHTAEPSAQEAIAPLTCDLTDVWRPARLPEDEGMQVGCPTEAVPTAYLPQEDWAPKNPMLEGDSSYCALCCGTEGQPPAPPENTLLPGVPPKIPSSGVCVQRLSTAWGQTPHKLPEDPQSSSFLEGHRQGPDSPEAPALPAPLPLLWREQTEASGAEA
ncbi:interleukin-9 receptor-like [Erinaceus europaeus]|uniref:Interleukin-9 receptor-like n=1 Tax=Erinaceus europaeus TaxID=9365 RepID=A0ABM3VVA3_ERIEU|nr:interleukin-9 receptor-like [Erinaceus europaeus]